jgi:hypothetical protein
MRTEEIETVRKLKLEANMLAGQVNGVQFNYNDPTKDFNRSKVKGVVARLLQVKDSSTMTALEVHVSQFSAHMPFLCCTEVGYLKQVFCHVTMSPVQKP